MLPDYQETECSCSECRDMCKTRCWPSPEEARKMIEAGLAERMMKEIHYIHDVEGEVHVVCPAIPNFGGKGAPWVIARKGCVFFRKDQKCELHGTGYKPIEARLADCRLDAQYDLHNGVGACGIPMKVEK
jgi:Fe-S-cluster containining protein